MRKNSAPAHMCRSNKVKLCARKKLFYVCLKKIEKVEFGFDYIF